MKNEKKSKRRPNWTTDERRASAQSLARVKKASEGRRFAMRARLAKRDLDYAESPCAAQVTVEERGNRVIETRGRACIGFTSAIGRVAY